MSNQKSRTTWKWPSNFTFTGRYDKTGVTDRFLEYVAASKKNDLKVLDVGCSVGIAIKDMQIKLRSMGIQIETTGIDSSEEVMEKANENLDHFILGDILHIEPSLNFDVVICSKLILHANGPVRSQVVGRCAEFLVNEGALVTDAGRYKKPPLFERAKVDFKDLISVISAIKHGPIGFFNGIKAMDMERMKRRMYLITGKNNVEKYSNDILDEWNDMGVLSRLDLRLTNFSQKLNAYTKKKPDYKKR